MHTWILSFSCSSFSSYSSFCSCSYSLLSYLLIATLVQREFLSCCCCNCGCDIFARAIIIFLTARFRRWNFRLLSWKRWKRGGKSQSAPFLSEMARARWRTKGRQRRNQGQEKKQRSWLEPARNEFHLRNIYDYLRHFSGKRKNNFPSDREMETKFCLMVLVLVGHSPPPCTDIRKKDVCLRFCSVCLNTSCCSYLADLIFTNNNLTAAKIMTIKSINMSNLEHAVQNVVISSIKERSYIWDCGANKKNLPLPLSHYEQKPIKKSSYCG